MKRTHKYTDSNRCYFCGLQEPENIKKGFRKLIEFHHIVEKNQGGSNSDHNLVPCCSTCHSKIHLNIIKLDCWINYAYAYKLRWETNELKYIGEIYRQK
jgi:hypothetical protein